MREINKSNIAIGYTLTGHDELEPNAALNLERIEAMHFAKDHGFKTFASIEPIIDFESSIKMIILSLEYCDLYKIGLESGKKYNNKAADHFIESLKEHYGTKFYLKESLQKLIGITNSELDENFVKRDYNLFKLVN